MEHHKILNLLNGPNNVEFVIKNGTLSMIIQMQAIV